MEPLFTLLIVLVVLAIVIIAKSIQIDIKDVIFVVQKFFVVAIF